MQYSEATPLNLEYFLQNVWDQRYCKCISLLSCLAGGYGAL